MWEGDWPGSPAMWSSEERLRNGGRVSVTLGQKQGCKGKGGLKTSGSDSSPQSPCPTWHKHGTNFPFQVSRKTSLEKCVQLMDSEQPLCARLSPRGPKISMATQPRPVPMQRLPCGGDTSPWTCDNCSGASGSGAGRVPCFLLESRKPKGEVSRADTQGKSTSDRHSGLDAQTSTGQHAQWANNEEADVVGEVTGEVKVKGAKGALDGVRAQITEGSTDFPSWLHSGITWRA